MATGNRPSPALDYPSLGSLAARVLPPRQGVPPYVTFAALREGVAGAGAGYLGPAYGPFEIEGEPVLGEFQAHGVSLPGGFSPGDLEIARGTPAPVRPRPARARFDRHAGGPGPLPSPGVGGPALGSRPVRARPAREPDVAPRRLRPVVAGAGGPRRPAPDRGRRPVRDARRRRLGHARRQLPNPPRPPSAAPGQGPLRPDSRPERTRYAGRDHRLVRRGVRQDASGQR